MSSQTDSPTGLAGSLHRARLKLWMARQVYPATLREKVRPEHAPDGLPVPPPGLRRLVGGSIEIAPFLKGGERIATTVRETLARSGVDIADTGSLLDFGAGCGRITRHWATLDRVEVFGTDYNRSLIAWCQKNLTFGSFATNGLAPPLSYLDERFGLVYAYSVFTHLSEELQRPWILELARVVRPGGHLLVTTHGEAFAADRLAPDGLARFRSGELVVRHSNEAGTNRCSAFHPQRYVREQFAPELELVELIEGAGPGRGSPTRGPQDIYLLRKPAATA